MDTVQLVQLPADVEPSEVPLPSQSHCTEETRPPWAVSLSLTSAENVKVVEGRPSVPPKKPAFGDQ